ncbi:carboxypeptidase-like regulatory domain-containing protein [Flavobacterium sp. LS1R49]|uniref:Carboxypeptidase-like regulatory domain-containing protein n=1 Tax=Flavobacterium shii TaxID=2987687 RepID=A0A9X2ZKD8_9FLAO|nr:carboxypeptidase-like regulatory domain-containing protein [Flavobacterium shii]MCV9929288.1 carboxypeptidase-like regulatory domain-containing protein [Flavobacterium shii]
MKIYHTPVLLFIFFMLPGFLQAQSIISGAVLDKKGNPISFANVFVKLQENQSIIVFTRTDIEGKYILELSETGNFEISFTAMSYKINTASIVIETAKKYIQNAVLEDDVTTLNEVIIKTEKPVIFKKDTIIFDGKAFAKGNEIVVEDLLRRIPGLIVSKNGTIKVGNKEVEKVMVEGDDFFEHGYKLLTKNLNASVIDKVEVYKRYSNNRLLKGIENSDKVALNLTLKKNIKTQWFGNMSLGYGVASENRYDVRTNLMSFKQKVKYYGIGNLNNVGVDAVGDVDYIIRPSSTDDISNIGDDQNAGKLLNLNGFKPNLKEERTNFNNAELVSLNSIITLSSKVKLKVMGFFNSDGNDFYRKGIDAYNAGGISFTNFENYILNKKKTIGFGKIDFNYDISKNQMFEYVGKFNYEEDNTKTNLIFNNEHTNEKLHENNQLLDQKVVYTNRFKDNKVLIFSGRFINEKTPQHYYNNVFLFQDLLPIGITANDVMQLSENRMRFIGFESQLLDKKESKNLLEVKVGYKNRYDVFGSKLQFYESDVIRNAPEKYSNDVKYTAADAYFKSKYNYVKGKFGIGGNLEFHQLITSLETSNKEQHENPFFVNPSIFLVWEINKKNRISTSYSYNTTSAKILDVYDGFVLTSYRSFEKGTGEINQLQSNSLFFSYKLGDWDSRFSLNTNVNYYQNHDFYSTNSVVQPNYSQIEKIIIKDRSMLNVNAYLGFLFSSISSIVKLDLNYSSSNYKNIVNNSSLREVHSQSTVLGPELKSNFKGFFNYNLGSKWTMTEFRTTVINKNTDNISFLDFLFVINKKLNAQIQTERYYFGNLDKENAKYYFLDLNANYIINNNKLSFSLSAKNLFNTQTFRQSFISDIVTSKTEYRILPRYVILKMDYRF